MNIRQKGAGGEREICDALNVQTHAVYKALDLHFSFADHGAQRNQNQSAVGGCDLVNTWGLAIEVKRQEALSINTWWTQCISSAMRLKEEPVLIFRQNREKWRVILNGAVALPPMPGELPWQLVRCEITFDAFLAYYKKRVEACLIGKLAAERETELHRQI